MKNCEEISENWACIIDPMSLVQKVKRSYKTFKEVTETLFRTAMSEKGSCNRVDLIFNVYKQKSRKTTGRRNRGEFASFLFCEDNMLRFLYKSKF